MSNHRAGLWNKPTQETVKQVQPACEEVARLAYELYEKRGCQHGHDQEDWFKAEEIVRQQSGGRKN